MITLDQHLKGLDLESAKEEAIELLAGQLMNVAEKSARGVLDASNYYVSYSDIEKAINECEKFNEAFEEIATSLIETSSKRDF